eukprot:398863-Rhodomonas_salina.1
MNSRCNVASRSQVVLLRKKVGCTFRALCAVPKRPAHPCLLVLQPECEYHQQVEDKECKMK